MRALRGRAACRVGAPGLMPLWVAHMRARWWRHTPWGAKLNAPHLWSWRVRHGAPPLRMQQHKGGANNDAPHRCLLASPPPVNAALSAHGAQPPCTTRLDTQAHSSPLPAAAPAVLPVLPAAAAAAAAPAVALTVVIPLPVPVAVAVTVSTPVRGRPRPARRRRRRRVAVVVSTATATVAEAAPTGRASVPTTSAAAVAPLLVVPSLVVPAAAAAAVLVSHVPAASAPARPSHGPTPGGAQRLFQGCQAVPDLGVPQVGLPSKMVRQPLVVVKQRHLGGAHVTHVEALAALRTR